MKHCVECGNELDSERRRRGATLCSSQCGQARQLRLYNDRRAAARARAAERPPFDDAIISPTQEQIAERAAAIRATWTMDREERAKVLRELP